MGEMSPQDRERYSRQILFAQIGERGQQAMIGAHAAVVGCGALGTFHAAALARAGVGRITIIDRDYVEPSNLQRQWLFDEQDAADGLPKAAAAQRKLARINSAIDVRGVVADLRPGNIHDLLEGAGVILDGLDNFETRFLLNDYAVSTATPWIYGAAVGSYGLVMPVIPKETACLRCVYPQPPSGAQPTCETAGVLNTITAAVASLQVSDALKLLSGNRAAVRPRITTIDVWDGGIRQILQPGRDPDCPACAHGEFPHLEGAAQAPISMCGRNAVQIHDRQRPLDLAGLCERLAPLGEVRANEFALRFATPPYEMTIFPDGRAIIKGTTEPGVARSLYARYIGS
jgi:adenylyltransferase/sulfurtransferase